MNKIENKIIKENENNNSNINNDKVSLTKQQFRELSYAILAGIKDSVKVGYAWRKLKSSDNLWNSYKSCVLLNGFIFLGTYLVYLYWVSPMLDYLLLYYPALSNVFSIIYLSLWVYPVYIFSIVANSKCYTDIAKETFNQNRQNFDQINNTNSNSNNGSNNSGKDNQNKFLSSIVDEIYRNLLFGVILVISVIISFIPYTNFLNFTLITWLYSFWCFDYKWILRGKWNLLQRITYFENHWAYMFGYGFLFTMFSFFFPVLIGNAIFSILYPLFIILSMSAQPQKLKTTNGLIPKHIPIFYIPEAIVNVILRLYVKYKNKPKKENNNNNNQENQKKTI